VPPMTSAQIHDGYAARIRAGALHLGTAQLEQRHQQLDDDYQHPMGFNVSSHEPPHHISRAEGEPALGRCPPASRSEDGDRTPPPQI
jgi:hypothetical protein